MPNKIKFISKINFQDSRAALTKNDKKFESPICEKKFATKNTLNRHKKIHGKVHQCKTCQKFFSRKSKLERHIRTHTGEKPYACLICDKRFRQKNHLKNHEATHSDERKFKCNICPDERSFKTKANLSHHMVYHYERKYSCPKCGKKFFNSTHLKGHKKSCQL